MESIQWRPILQVSSILFCLLIQNSYRRSMTALKGFRWDARFSSSDLSDMYFGGLLKYVESDWPKSGNEDRVLTHLDPSCSGRRRVRTREYWMIYRGQSFLLVIWFGSSPTTFPTSPLSKSFLFLSLPVRRRPSLLRGRGGEMGGRRTKSYEREKAWPTINL